MTGIIGAMAVVRRQRLRRHSQIGEQPVRGKSLSRAVIDLQRLAVGAVPAHGLAVGCRGISAAGLGGKFLLWLRKLAGAVSIAGMIALGLFVYTEFTEAWGRRGLPSIPISALAALDQTAQRPPGTQGMGDHPRDSYQSRRRSEPRQQMSLIDDYIG